MVILDLDIDLFLNKIANHRSDQDPRLDPSEFVVDSEDLVGGLLRGQCQLSNEAPVPGALFDHHVEVFWHTKRMVESGLWTPPFTWIHADAHDDLNGPFDPARDPNSGNFMLYLLNEGWIREFILVRHPDDRSVSYHKSHPTRIEINGRSAPYRQYLKVISGEEDALIYKPFQMNRPPDFLFVVRSPAFTPPSSDAVFDYCRQFVDAP